MRAWLMLVQTFLGKIVRNASNERVCAASLRGKNVAKRAPCKVILLVVLAFFLFS